ncbi:MAG: hypothetical protein ACW99A_01380 [Candidatus Kariarchaeaceae archaeon]
MKKTQSFLWILAITILLLFSTNTIKANEINNIRLTEDTALTIAKNNNEVSAWLNTTSGELWRIDFDNFYWYIVFDSKIDDSFLHVTIDDPTEEIISINYSEFSHRWDYSYDEALLVTAREFFDEILADANYTTLNFEYNIWYSGVANYLEIDGWYYSNEFDAYMRGIMKFNQTQNGSYEFSLVQINSDTQFIASNHSYENITDLAEWDADIKNFKGNYTVDHSYFGQLLVLEEYRRWESDVMISNLEPGIYFEVRLHHWGYDEDVTTTTVTSPTLNTVTQNIEIIDYADPWIGIIISDDTGEIVRKFGSFMREHTTTEIVDLVVSDPEVMQIIQNNNDVTIRIYFSGYYTIHVDLWTDWYDWANFQIDDRTGEIIEKSVHIAILPTKTRDDIISIAMNNYDIIEYISNVDQFRTEINYNYNGIWHITFFDPILVAGGANIEINDTDGSVLWSGFYFGNVPSLSQAEVIDIALTVDLRDFYNDYPDAVISMYYEEWNEEWQVFVYSSTVLEAHVQITINDRSGRIESGPSYDFPYQNPSSDLNEILLTMYNDESYNTFVSTKKIEYQTVYYYEGYWRVYIEATDEIGVVHLFDMEINDDPSYVSYSNEWSNRDFYMYEPRGDAISWHIFNSWDGKWIGKQVSTPLGDVIGNYTPTESNPVTSHDNDDTSKPSLELEGFSLFPSLLTIALIIPIYMKRKRN